MVVDEKPDLSAAVGQDSPRPRGLADQRVRPAGDDGRAAGHPGRDLRSVLGLLVAAQEPLTRARSPKLDRTFGNGGPGHSRQLGELADGPAPHRERTFCHSATKRRAWNSFSVPNTLSQRRSRSSTLALAAMRV